ncbi:MAG TPA: hypothetical protein VF339_06900 [Gammaproteobacteria bacterium]
MAKNAWQELALAMLSLALPFAANAQDAAAVLGPVADALQIEEVKALKVVAAGSGYEKRSTEPRPASVPAALVAAGRATADPSSPMYVPPPAPRARSYFRIVSQVQELDLAAESLEIEQVRASSSAPDAAREPATTTTIDANADWSLRHRYWLTPHAFVAGALAHDASVGMETLDGTEYRVVSFTVDGHEVRGYVDPADKLVRVRTTVDGEDGETDVIESFFDWTEQGELTFPSMLIRKENGELAEVLVVQEIDTGTSG